MTNHDEQLLSADQGELTIIIRPHGAPYCEYVGNRAQLEAEGVIPDGTEWPAGFYESRWEANGIEYQLRRERPKGAKGPRRAFLDCDNWCLRMNLPGCWPDYRIKSEAKELERTIYRQSPAGIAEFIRRDRLYITAYRDEKFQAFKALIPALPRRAGRRKMQADNPKQPPQGASRWLSSQMKNSSR